MFHPTFHDLGTCRYQRGNLIRMLIFQNLDCRYQDEGPILVRLKRATVKSRWLESKQISMTVKISQVQGGRQDGPATLLVIHTNFESPDRNHNITVVFSFTTYWTGFECGPMNVDDFLYLCHLDLFEAKALCCMT
ncbi:hypothetical protein EX30DRAFT_130354 [Ascodesmis nigricans]|uniref:Uncharacterized protein n=1 Tax=Ascodesmis nigricans TaxID=341454 RepID=A0A4S2MNM8_9PEZI|nr:hypothetical protein EX30DRAFT_130354 [Ascodesmis nigricans]